MNPDNSDNSDDNDTAADNGICKECLIVASAILSTAQQICQQISRQLLYSLDDHDGSKRTMAP